MQTSTKTPKLVSPTLAFNMEELNALRNLARMLEEWLKEDTICIDDLKEILKVVKKAQRDAKKRPN